MKKTEAKKVEQTLQQIVKPLDYFFVLRPTLFFPVWTVFMAGYFVQQKFEVVLPHTNNQHVIKTLIPKEFLIPGLFLTLLMGAVFILNQIQDRITDHENNKLFLIAQNHIPVRVAYVEAGLLILAALGFAFFNSIKMGVIFALILLITGYFYSFEPFSWKNKPIAGLVTNMLGAYIIFTAGWFIHGSLNQRLLVHATPYALAVASVYLYTTLPDVKGDASSEKLTFGVKYGIELTLYAGFLFELAALVISLILQDEVIFYPAFFALPFFVLAVIRKQMKDIVRSIKYPILFLSLAICVKYPPFFFILLIVYFLSKLYYRLRFGIDYPNLN